MSDYRKAYDGLSVDEQLHKRLEEIPDTRRKGSHKRLVTVVVTAAATMIMTLIADIICYAATDESIVGHIIGKKEEKKPSGIVINGEPASPDDVEKTDGGYIIHYRPKGSGDNEIVVQIPDDEKVLNYFIDSDDSAAGSTDIQIYSGE